MHFGAKAATIRGHTGTTTIVRSPKGTGTVDVTVTTAGGTSAKVAGDKFKYVAPPPKPSVTKVVPTNGPLGGGDTVTITGKNFTGTTAVHFGTVKATSPKVVLSLIHI